MNVEEVVTKVVRGRSSVFKSLDHVIDGLDSGRMFELYKEFYDAVINEPMVDISSIRSIDTKQVQLVADEGTFRIPVDKFVVYHGAKGHHVLLYFKRKHAQLLRTSTGSVATDTLEAIGVALDPDGATHAKMPLSIVATNANGKIKLGVSILTYSGVYPDDLMPKELALNVLMSLAMFIWLANSDASALKVPAVRRTLNEVAKRKH